jgi:hypothetical protein
MEVEGMATLTKTVEPSSEAGREINVLAMSAQGRRALAIAIANASDPGFEEEYRREMALIAEHDRQTGNADRVEPDEEDLKGWV